MAAQRFVQSTRQANPDAPDETRQGAREARCCDLAATQCVGFIEERNPAASDGLRREAPRGLPSRLRKGGAQSAVLAEPLEGRKDVIGGGSTEVIDPRAAILGIGRVCPSEEADSCNPGIEELGRRLVDVARVIKGANRQSTIRL